MLVRVFLAGPYRRALHFSPVILYHVRNEWAEDLFLVVRGGLAGEHCRVTMINDVVFPPPNFGLHGKWWRTDAPVKFAAFPIDRPNSVSFPDGLWFWRPAEWPRAEGFPRRDPLFVRVSGIIRKLTSILSLRPEGGRAASRQGFLRKRG